MKQLSLWTLLCFPFVASSQTTIRGILQSSNDEPISGASITITDTCTDNIIAYSFSDKDGKYEVVFRSGEKAVCISIQSMSYSKIVKSIENKSRTQNFKLQDEHIELREVVVKPPPITRRGDTINYHVNSFVKEPDRSIADVLKRMPGLDVLSDGKVIYQGKPINKYYIEGLDLLGGKYNLVNQNLPHADVLQVQIIENHQPLNILDSLVFSDKAALNINLKNKHTFTGQVELGAGFSPLLWDVNATPMLFTKQQQMLISYQSNNIGKNVASQFKTLSIEDLLEQFESGSEKRDLLSIQKLSLPNFPDKRWLDNNIHLLAANYLHNLKKDYELRLNVLYLNDYQQQSGFANTLFITPFDSIPLFEETYNQFYHNSLEANLILQKNTKHNYLKNTLQFQGSWDSQRGIITTNSKLLVQNLSNYYFETSNRLKTIFSLGKHLVTLNSYVSLNKTPQTLKVNPGQFNDMLNNGNTYDEVIQKVSLRTFYANNSLGFTSGWKSYTFSPQIGVQFENQNLYSYLQTNENQNLPSEFHNDLDWMRSRFYFRLQTQYKKKKWRIELNTPLNMLFFSIKDIPLQESQKINKPTFEPKLSLIYDANTYWQFNISANINNQFGTIDQFHYAYILLSYRNIQRIKAPLPKTYNQSLTGGISYRNPIKSIFGSVIYTYVNSQHNILYNSQILDNGEVELEAIKQDNNRKSHSLSGRISKYFRDINTNMALSTSYGMNDFQLILNTNATSVKNQSWNINGSVDADFTSWFNAEYNAAWVFSNNKVNRQQNKTIIRQIHKLGFNFFLNEHQYIGLKTEFIRSNLFAKNSETFFTDLTYRYTWKKKNIDVEIQWDNIFNTKNYQATSVNDYTYIETIFRLRPSRLLLKIRFSL
ncbi:MAG: carboxypeptidase-like regulatory domain-containing protein [Prevotellaceae bacterium]|jgi:hypothetical protein|nr:carboxypeptidase-like regulatory domain-containing protein [Prevotellaceae bacterium]